MNKMKLNYTPSKNEFVLLSVLLVVALLALYVNYLGAPLTSQVYEAAQEKQMQQAALDNLKAEYANLGQYQRKEDELSKQLAELQQVIPGYFSEEEILSSLDTVSAQSGLELLGISFGGVQTEQRAAFLASLKLSADTTGANETTAPAATEGGPYVCSERITVSYKGTYDALVKFMSELESQDRQVYFRNAVFSRSEDGSLSGSLVILVFSQLETDPAEQDYPNYDYQTPTMPGKTDPFAAYASYEGGTATAGNTMASPDFYAIINSYDDNSSKLLFGKYPVSGAQVTADKNANTTATLTLSKSGSQINYSYQLGSDSYSGSYSLATDATQITMNVLSRARKSALDLVGLTLNVQNTTGMELVITVKNDDPTTHRFDLGTTSGRVRVAD